MSEQKANSPLVLSQTNALTLSGPASLAKRGLADLQTRGSADSLFKLALMFRRRKQYDKSLNFLQRALAVESQHLEAMTWLGVAYNGGRGVERDEVRAIQYFRDAADRGHAHAQFCLGNCYAQGDGVKKNLQEAASWYRRAAEQGDEGAQWELALLLYHGTDGCEDEDAALKNRKEAALWFQKAAEQESRDAAGRLAGMYSTGKGVRRSQEQRDFWNQRSIDIDRRSSLR
ncbi:MAG: tetratricopeptide repeat protein, partial [Terracidiphilus sp.]